VKAPGPGALRGVMGVGAVSIISGIVVAGDGSAVASDGRLGAILRGDSATMVSAKGDGPTGSVAMASASRAGDSAIGLGILGTDGSAAGGASVSTFTEATEPSSESVRPGVEGRDIDKIVDDRRITLPIRERKDLDIV
jgi:hypothetical protein